MFGRAAVRTPFSHHTCLQGRSRILMRSTRLHCYGHNVFKPRGFSTIVSVSEMFITLHEGSALPWLVMIPLTTISLRTVFTLPLSILQRKRLIKQNELRNIVSSIKPVVQLRLAQTKKLSPEQITMLSLKETRTRQKRLFSKYKVEMWKNMILPLVQLPLWVTISLALRKLTSDSTTGTLTALHETNTSNFLYHLNVLDSTLDLSLPFEPLPMLLPIVLGTLSIINVEYNGMMFAKRRDKALTSTKLSSGMQSIISVSRMSSIFMMGVSTQTSMILTTYWITSQLFSLIQNIILDWLWPLHNKHTIL